MPIAPDIAPHYPDNWDEIRSKVIARSRRRAPWIDDAWPCCEWCGKPDGYEVDSYANGWEMFTSEEWFSVTPDGQLKDHRLWEDINPNTKSVICAFGSGSTTRVVLTVAHLDQDPRGDDIDRLRALCQRCHLTYDNQPSQKFRRRMIYAELRGQGTLPLDSPENDGNQLRLL